MKKAIISLLLLVVPVSLFAQLMVKSDGRVISGYEFVNSSLHPSLQAGINLASGGVNFGVFGFAGNVNNIGISYGIFGNGEKAASNYGVAGVKENYVNGAGVFGANFFALGYSVSANYAGYFMGDTKVTGTMTVSSLVQTSDLRLKDNIVSLNRRNESILDKVLDMNVVEYNYKSIIPSLLLPDTVSVEDVIDKAGIDISKKHYGVIAQELQELFPTLVEEGQDGYLGVNYVELVPVLVRAIQELKAQVDALQSNSTKPEFRAPSTSDISPSLVSDNILYQNTPNPFNEQTTIRFSLSDNVQDAAICIFDMQGKMLKNIPISSGMNSISVSGPELGKGLFLYSLVINGQEIDTKKMIISK